MKRRRALLPLPERAARMLARFKSIRWLDEDEKALFALGFAATPEERWKLVRNHIQLFNSFCKSKLAAGRDKDKLHILLIRQALRLKRGTTGKRRIAKSRRRATRKRFARPSS